MNKKIEELKEYEDIDIEDLTMRKRREMRQALETTIASQLETVEDHRLFLRILKKYRYAVQCAMDDAGTGLAAQLQEMLANGGGGIYSDKRRFLYELIQNVDDCEYDDGVECALDVHFDWNPDADGYGQIVLNYNEKGFTPENVFAITGIAEQVKNISDERIEIGEKGIGFKSVFGVSNRVRIESGQFAFELYGDRMMEPVEAYDNYEYIKGTRLTLFVESGLCISLFRKMMDEYKDEHSIISNNPIMFLNKLKHLRIYYDSFRSMLFSYECMDSKQYDEELILNKIRFNIEIKDEIDLNSYNVNNEFIGYKFMAPITYDHELCLSRYGERSGINKRLHRLIAVFPQGQKNFDFSEGRLYSFLPTKISLSVPIMIHAPYRLDVSREFVDSQNNNEWFKFTSSRLKEFIKKIYKEYAVFAKENIVRYIPKDNLFVLNNEKIECLYNLGIDTELICSEKIFYTTAGSFENSSDVTSFAENDKIDDKKTVYAMLEIEKKLFIPAIGFNVTDFGITTIRHPLQMLFKRSLKSYELTESALEYIDKHENKDKKIKKDKYDKYERVLTEMISKEKIVFNKKQLLAMSKYEWLSEQCRNLSKLFIEDKFEGFSLAKGIKGDALPDIYIGMIKDARLDNKYMDYLTQTGYRIIYINKDNRDFVMLSDKGIVIIGPNVNKAFIDFTSYFDEDKLLSSSMRLRNASEELNRLNENDDIDKEKYISRLRRVRLSVKNILGAEGYERYVKIINDSRKDRRLFVNELLQNADDCTYAKGVTPQLTVRNESGRLRLKYNEKGFSNVDVRAITAVGESTKTLIQKKEYEKIGNKGIGFKSIFAVASKVEIFSNGYNFKLIDKEPTIPEILKCEHDVPGTQMLIYLKNLSVKKISSLDILELALCLRKLKNISFFTKKLTMEDDGKHRTVTYKKDKYVFYYYDYRFSVDDNMKQGMKISNINKLYDSIDIRIYSTNDKMPFDYKLYNGLPTEIKIKAPMIIDAPLELTNSREQILNIEYNERVCQMIYEAVFDFIETRVKEEGIKALRYINIGQNSKGEYVGNLFSEGFLNNNRWIIDKIKNSLKLPVFGKENDATISEKMIVLPEFILDLCPKLELLSCFDVNILDGRGYSGKSSTLRKLGCNVLNKGEVCELIERLQYKVVYELKFLKELYKYLSTVHSDETVREQVESMAIIPVKTENGTKYVSFTKDIYITDDENELSTEDYYILDQKIMSEKEYHDVFSECLGMGVAVKEINEFTLTGAYINKIERLLKSKDSNEHIAEALLTEFHENRDKIHNIKGALMENREIIPVENLKGEYICGLQNMYSYESTHQFRGKMIKAMLPQKRFLELAAFVGIPSIETLHYTDNEIINSYGSVSDMDIEDLISKNNHIVDYYGVLKGLFEKGSISDAQIKKYGLEFYTPGSALENEDELFPGEYLDDDIYDEIRHMVGRYDYNKYVITDYVPKWMPERELDRSYLFDMYGSEMHDGYSFCQMCGEIYNNQDMTQNSIELEPKYAWKEMHLNLCPKCSRQYERFRRFSYEIQNMIKKIMSVDIWEDENYTIELEGDMDITFTAEHIAAIRAIYDRQGWGVNAPVRKMYTARD